MPVGCDTCEYHEDRGLLIAAHGERITSVEVEVKHMNEAQVALVGRFDRAAAANEKVLKEMCADLKVLKARSTPKAGAAAAEEEIERAFANQPVGYLNTMLKKVFTNPVFWALVGWAVIKIFLFGEYPAFSPKVRPYMEPVVKQQTEIQQKYLLVPAAKPSEILKEDKAVTK